MFGIASRRARFADQSIDRFGAHIDDNVADGIGVHDLAALFVNHLALIVHHIVIFDDLFALIIVARLDLFLGGLDRFRHPFRRRQRLAVLEVRTQHLGEERIGPEYAQQIVVEAEVEARQAGIALTPGTTAQLIVNTPAFVAFGGEDEQAAGVLHLAAFLGNLVLDLVDGSIALRTLHHFSQLVINAEFDITAELDVGAAASHVGGYCDHAGAPRLRDDMRLALMLAGVQNAMRNAFLI